MKKLLLTILLCALAGPVWGAEWRQAKIKDGACTAVEVSNNAEIRKADTKMRIRLIHKNGKTYCPV